jgi:hypothetical protein
VPAAARDDGRPALTARAAARRAAEHLAELTGRPPEGVTFMDRTEAGWSIGIEVVESHRVPDTTDILAVYRLDLDDGGELLGYRRDERYYRGRGGKD